VENRVARPDNDEIEVSVFGPGYGESILLHLGQNEWIVVDSCLHQHLGIPPTLTYLRSLGIEPSEAVKLVVATHWHDDHVRGLATILRECTSARFVCSAALASDDFLTLVEAFGSRSMMTSSGVEEFKQIIDILRHRVSTGRSESRGPDEWASENKILYQRPASPTPCRIYSLSPSSASITLAFIEMGSLLPSAKDSKKRLVAQRPNSIAVVLWIEIADVSILLGSDLEETSNPATGWSMIVNSHNRPFGRASVFKIPHHGSETADQPAVWCEMIREKPYAVLTPFSQGNISLPSKKIAEAICQRTDNAYSTAILRRRPRRSSPSVERTIRETVRRINVVDASMGHVRIRRKIATAANEWSTDLFGDAIPLQRLIPML